ncbi:MAG: beta-N-acetylhexosaminidase [Pseudomonadota bacterium]
MKLGKHFIIGFDGTTASKELVDFLRAEEIGGVILFTRNFESHSQIKKLISKLKSKRDDLIVAVDYEGGRVQRFKGKGFTTIPPMGNVKDETQAYELALTVGKELKSIGIDLDFAPVLDLFTNPKNQVIGDRAFSSDPKVASQRANMFIKGLKGSGIITCGKHFPGHGETALDSHETLPTINVTSEVLHERELVPFRSAIDEGVDMIMTAHLMIPALDELEPATTSRLITTDLLRGVLGFQGVIITDDLNMQGILKRYPVSESAWRALDAGADMVLICEPGFEDQHLAIKRLEQAIKNNEISSDQLKLSQNRITKTAS